MFKGAGLAFKLYSGFGMVLLIVAALGGFSYYFLIDIKENAEGIVSDNMPGIYTIGRIEAAVNKNMTLAASHILAQDKTEIESVEKEFAGIRKEISGLFEEYEKSIRAPRDRELFNAIAPLRAAFAAVMIDRLMPASRAGKKQEAKEIFDGAFKEAYGKYSEAVSVLEDYNKSAGDKEGEEIMHAVSSAEEGILIGLIAALATGAAIGFFLSRSISSALNRVIASLTQGSEQVSSASSQVSQSSQQMAEGASEQASSLEETSASLEEISSMTKQNSDNAGQANLMASVTRQAVEKSRSAMGRMSEAIGQIKGSSDQTAKIVKTIDEIAFQTNLLALNAAVEAARAGDAGKGFAVVAEEVRNLAQRSAEAAKTTSSLIEQSQKNSDNGVAVSQEVAEILTQIVDSVGKLSQLIGEVSSANQEQSKGIEQIGTAVAAMDKLTQSNAASAEESASASEELSAQANELNDMVNVLVGIVSGTGANANRPPRHDLGFARRPPAAAGKSLQGYSKAPGKKPLAKGAASKAAPKRDWSAVPATGNGRLARVGRPEAVIPLNDDELKDF
jgi:methyl-accepting chemotaxis protein